MAAPSDISTRSNRLQDRHKSSSQSFPSTHRLLRSAEYKRVAQVGRKINSKHFLIFYLATQTPPRLGITITKKIDSRSARRNRLRRRLREIFRKSRNLFIQCVDLVVIARHGSELLDINEIAGEIINSLIRAGILPKQV